MTTKMGTSNETPRRAAPRLVSILLFLLGVSQFFVRWEPGPSEILTLMLLPSISVRALLHPAMLLLQGLNLVALTLELLLLGSAEWSLISVLLVVQATILLSVFYRYGRAPLEWLIRGAAIGAAVTLLLSLAPVDLEMYKYGIRFTGLFKDPNVTAPTALFFSVMAISLPRRERVLAVAPFVVFLLAISRGTILAFLVCLVLALAFWRPLSLVFSLPVGFFFLVNGDYVTNFINSLLSSIGRGGMMNSYDNDRADNWTFLLERTLLLGRPLGPGYSEANGFSVHSTYLRIATEQGWLALALFMVVAVYCLFTRDKVARFGLLILLVNSVIVDGTHWRVLFIALAFALASEPRFANAATTTSPMQGKILHPRSDTYTPEPRVGSVRNIP